MKVPREGERLYGDLAWLWPIVSPPQDYREEADFAAKAVVDAHRGRPRTLLHLGCGGGHLDLFLKHRFTVTGVDVSEDMLALASRLNPEVRYLRGDMRSFRTEERFDAVLALDSVNYLLSEHKLSRTFSTAYEALRPGGVFVTYVEHAQERFAPGAWCSRHDAGEVTVTFLEDLHDPDPGDTTFELALLFLVRKGDEATVEADRHLQGLFPTATWTELLARAGLDVTTRSDGPEPKVTWLVGRRP